MPENKQSIGSESHRGFTQVNSGNTTSRLKRNRKAFLFIVSVCVIVAVIAT